MSQSEHQAPFTLYKQPKSKRWSVRFSIKGQGQQKRSLGVEDYDQALALAEEIWRDAKTLAKAGLSVKQKKFATVAEEFIEQLEHDVRRGEKQAYQLRQFVPVIQRYFIGFFGGKLLTVITPNDVEDYWKWRIDYWESGVGSKQPYIRYVRVINGKETSIRRPVKEGRPSNSTLTKEALLLKQIFQFGQQRGYTLEPPFVRVPKSKKLAVRAKPGFTLKEFLHLETVSEQRVVDAAADQNNEYLNHDRSKLHCYCMIAAFTCVFRDDPATDSDSIRPPIPI